MPTPTPTPLPPPPPPPNPYEGCTPRPLSGICPPGSFPNGGYCCPGGGSCGNFASLAAPGGEPDDAPTSNIASGGGGGCGCDEVERTNCYTGGGEWSETYCTCVSPVLLDIDGDGFDLTDGAGGVAFDFTGDGTPELLAWTAAGSDDSWLFLDRDGNGIVDDGRELFGSFTPQPSPPPGEQRNGFLALAVYDWPGNGGNADDMIDVRDAVYTSLRLWRDANHNGVSEPGELSDLSTSGVSAINLAYKESKRTDAHDNRFRYRARVEDARGARAGRWAWDVFPVRPR